MEQNQLPIQKVKVVFLGDQSVGKTSIVTRFMYDTFDSTYQATIGIDFLAKTRYLPDRTIRLQLWDTAGQERFRSLIPNYIRDSTVAIVVYDITNRASFEATKKWVHHIRMERNDQVIIMLVGNKTDLIENSTVTTEEGEKQAKELGALFIDVSAKTSFNINNMFNKICAEIPLVVQTRTEHNRIEVHASSKQSKSSCAC